MKYPPAQVVDFVLEQAAYSGSSGIQLSDLWASLIEYLSSNIDDFLKSIIWKWTLEASPEGSFSVYKKGVSLALPLGLDYQEFVTAHGPEELLSLRTSDDIQWRYLTGLAPSKRLRAQLGEFPFQLLGEIARSNKNGILAPDLSRATGQDPRSLTPRLKKLEDMGFILKKSVYNEKSRQHTSLCIHKRFAAVEMASTQLEVVEDLESSRNVQKTKQAVVQAVKVAPNHLRGFSDLKVELKLDKNQSSSKFFRSIVEYLDKRGFVEKLMVREEDGKPLVYCIKYLKDLPKEYDENAEFNDFFEAMQADDQIDDHEKEGNTYKLPSLNKVFPIQNQYYELIQNAGDQGATSMDIVKDVTGVSDCRPYSKVLDNFTSFVIDGEKLKSLKKYDDEYSNYSIVRGYDFEGKYKFYRYFTRETFSKTSNTTVAKHKSKETKNSIKSQSIAELSKKHYSPLGRITQKSLSGKKIATDVSENLQPAVKRGRPKKIINNEDDVPISKRPRGRPPTTQEPLSTVALESSEHNEKFDSSLGEGDTELNSVSSTNRSKENLEESKPDLKKDLIATSTGSLKAIKRRAALMAIIRELGGVTYTTANLCRLVDEKLGSSTITDKKTLARDVSYLINLKELEVEDISFFRAGQSVTRKLLILTNPKERPSAEKIEDIKGQCLADNGKQIGVNLKVKVIDDKVTLFNIKKSEKRLTSLNGSKTKKLKPKYKVKQEHNETNSVEKEVSNSQSDLAFMPKKRRNRTKSPKKVPKKSKSKTDVEKRRIRGSTKFDQTDATNLYRSVIISRTFKRGPIDFDSISKLFPGISITELRRKWITIRKIIGGLSAVMRGINVFERIVTKGIEEGLVTSSDLNEIDYEFFLILWRDADNSVLEGIDTNPLFKTLELNQEHYEIPKFKDNKKDLYEQLEENSMRQKEYILASKTFCYKDEPERIVPCKYDDLKSVLKATFATPEDKFSSQAVANIFSQFDENDTKEASTQLLKDKELSYFTLQESNTRFILADKFNNTLVQKVFNYKFFEHAAQFSKYFNSLSEDGKGLILSQGISSGEVATLLNLVVDGKAKMTRLDKSYKFTGYESRLIDKSKLSCDIVVSRGDAIENTSSSELLVVPIPTGKACSHIWIDLSGGINTDLWIKILISTLYHIVFRPGIQAFTLYEKLKHVLSVKDFKIILKWLQQSKLICELKDETSPIYVEQNWNNLLGD